MDFWAWVFVVCNVGITLGYLFVATCVAPYFTLDSNVTKAAGIGFFVTCAFTHLEHAVNTVALETLHYARHGEMMLSWPSILIHAVQVVAVWVFVLGLYKQFAPQEPMAVTITHLRGRDEPVA